MNIWLIEIYVLNLLKCIVKTVNLCFISIFSCLSGLSVFVEILESSSENHNVMFLSMLILDVIWVFKYWILQKAISDQLKYTILLKLALLELPHCLIVLSYLSQHTLNTWVWLFLDTNKTDLLRNNAVLYSTGL